LRKIFAVRRSARRQRRETAMDDITWRDVLTGSLAILGAPLPRWMTPAERAASRTAAKAFPQEYVPCPDCRRPALAPAPRLCRGLWRRRPQHPHPTHDRSSLDASPARRSPRRRSSRRPRIRNINGDLDTSISGPWGRQRSSLTRVIVAAKLLEERNRDGRYGIMMRDLGARLPDVVHPTPRGRRI
jgi:hypothetical protein